MVWWVAKPIVNVLPTPAVFYLNHYLVVIWKAPYSMLYVSTIQCCMSSTVAVVVVFWVGKPIVNVWRITGRRWAITGLSYEVCMGFVLSGLCVVHGICNIMYGIWHRTCMVYVCAMCMVYVWHEVYVLCCMVICTVSWYDIALLGIVQYGRAWHGWTRM